MQHSPAMDTKIRALAIKLEDIQPKITRCHVVVDEVDKHKNKGNLFEVRVDIHVPGKELVANHRHEDAYVAIGTAFDVMLRQLEDQARIQRGDVKLHREASGDTP